MLSVRKCFDERGADIDADEQYEFIIWRERLSADPIYRASAHCRFLMVLSLESSFYSNCLPMQEIPQADIKLVDYVNHDGNVWKGHHDGKVVLVKKYKDEALWVRTPF